MSETYRSRGSQGTGRGKGPQGRKTSRQSSADRVLAVQNARNLGSGTSQRGSSNRRRRKRRQGPDAAKILLILIGVVILLICAAVGFKSCGRDEKPKETAEKTTEAAAEPETELEAEITVNGVSVHGLTKSDAKEAVLKSMDWNLQVTYNGETKDVPNLMEENVDAVLEKAFGSGKSGTYTVEAEGMDEKAKAQADALADGWDVKPKNGSISSYDKGSGEFVFAGAEKGKLIDREKLAADIAAAVKAGTYKTVITASASEVEPEITEAQAKASFKRLGTYTTTTTSNKDRNENIRIASSALNGLIIRPGEEFSFNLTTGNRTTDKGYRPAGAYQNGVLVEEPGGGVCQVSSTLYNAVVFSGLKTTERHAHSYEPSYVTPGEDAMVSYDGFSGPDMKFVNNSKTAVGIKTSFSNQKLTISIYGSPILEEGVTLSMRSEKTKELNPPKPIYEEDPYLEPNVEQEVKAAKPGSLWVTDLVTKKDGKVVSEVLLHNSTYNGKPATVKRNTSGTVQTTEAPTVPGESPAVPNESQPESAAPTQAPEPSEPGNVQGPGFTEDHNSQNGGPGNVIESPSAQPGGNGGPGFENPQSNTGTPGGSQSPETAGGPSDLGLISPIG